MTYVYTMVCNGNIKIGVSDNPESRRNDLQVSNPDPVYLAGMVKMDSRIQAFAVEQDLHRRYAKIRVRGEWFKGLRVKQVLAMAEKTKVKHSKYKEEPRNLCIDYFVNILGKEQLSTFAQECKDRGYIHFYVDKTEYSGKILDKCLYVTSALRSEKPSLVGCYNKTGGKIFNAPKDSFSVDGRNLLRIPLEALL